PHRVGPASAHGRQGDLPGAGRGRLVLGLVVLGLLLLALVALGRLVGARHGGQQQEGGADEQSERASRHRWFLFRGWGVRRGDAGLIYERRGRSARRGRAPPYPMRRTTVRRITLLGALVALALSARGPTLHADEGMWLLSAPPGKRLQKAHGFTLI